MSKENRSYKAHVLAVPWQTPGHMNPMLQLCKRLVWKGLKATLAVTKFRSKSLELKFSSVQVDTISDGYDEGGFSSIPECLARFKEVGPQTIAELIKKYESMGQPIDCVIYDSLLPWVVDVPKQMGLAAACLLTQQNAVNYVLYNVYHGKLRLPVSSLVSIPGLPLLDNMDLPYFVDMGRFELVQSQFSTIDKADYVLNNTFYKLENEGVDAMSKVCPLMPIGPTVPSFYLDSRVENDKEYGLSVLQFHPSECMDWLGTKPAGSVVYISFGSVPMASPGERQMEELAWGLKASNYYFLWIVKDYEKAKLPKSFMEETSEKGLMVEWCPQLEVLSSKAVGCFVSHCGWNSTIEALSLGVPMVAMPQWADQPTNAKFIQDIWRIGIRAKADDDRVVDRKEIQRCIRVVIEEEQGKEMKQNALKWKELAKEATSEGGTSDKNIDEFISKLTESLCRS